MTYTTDAAAALLNADDARSNGTPRDILTYFRSDASASFTCTCGEAEDAETEIGAFESDTLTPATFDAALTYLRDNNLLAL